MPSPSLAFIFGSANRLRALTLMARFFGFPNADQFAADISGSLADDSVDLPLSVTNRQLVEDFICFLCINRKNQLASFLSTELAQYADQWKIQVSRSGQTPVSARYTLIKSRKPLPTPSEVLEGEADDDS